MSRRKQTKPHHLHSDSGEEAEDGRASKNHKLTPNGLQLHDPGLAASPSAVSTDSTVTPPAVTTDPTLTPSAVATDPIVTFPQEETNKDKQSAADGDFSKVKEEDVKANVVVNASSTPDHRSKAKEEDVKPHASFDTSSKPVPHADILRPPKKRGRPPLYTPHTQAAGVPDYSKSRSSIATALNLAAASSPRRQSLRLHPPAPGFQETVGKKRGRGRGRHTEESRNRKMSHRTCEYCGVVKPTPAALQRHLRKHTGERPFVCQICQKAYKAKRSLHCHQITNHPQLLDGGLPFIPPGVSDLEAAGSLATVSSSTSHLLRETLETRKMARQTGLPDDSSAVPDFVKSLMVMARGLNGQNTVAPEVKPPGGLIHDKDRSKSPGSADTTADLSVNVSTLSSSLDDSELEGEEGGGDLSRRSCPHCHKVFSKPSDMKRHLMVHTGERPYVCQHCSKAFKQLGSLNYHLKAAHHLDVPLSQGLEERYLRLKTRSAMRSLALMDSQGDLTRHPLTSSHLYTDADVETDGEKLSQQRQFLQSLQPPSPSPSSFPPPGLGGGQQGSWLEDRGLTPSVVEVEVEVPQVSGGDGGEEGVRVTTTKVQMAVRRETVLFTQLEGVSSSTGHNLQVFRCCLCDKVCASIYQAFSHLAAHFQPQNPHHHHHPPLECHACCLTFVSRSDMADHYRQKHGVPLSDLDLQNNNHNLTSLNDPAEDGYDDEEDERGLLEDSSSSKMCGRIDDLNNNDGNHINKEGAVCEEEEGGGGSVGIGFSSHRHKGEVVSDENRHDPPPASSFSSLPRVNGFNKDELAEEKLAGGETFACYTGKGGLHRNNELDEEDYAAVERFAYAGKGAQHASELDEEEPAGEAFAPSPYTGKGAHRCPQCSKCYMTQFLLDRHAAFHSRQDLIQAAMRSGVKVSAAQKDLLLQPPPVLPQDSTRFLKLKELSAAARHAHQKELDQEMSAQAAASSTSSLSSSSSLSPKKTEIFSHNKRDLRALDTLALLQKEGIQEDVTVVMPSDPDMDDDDNNDDDGEEGFRQRDRETRPEEVGGGGSGGRRRGGGMWSLKSAAHQSDT